MSFLPIGPPMATMMSHFSPFPIDAPTLRVQGLGVQERMRPVFFDRPRGWPMYLFVLFHDGARCRTRGVEMRVAPGTLICWRPGTPHGLGDDARPWNHSWLSVGGTDVARALRATDFPLDAPLPTRDTAFVDVALAELFEELARPAVGADARDPAVIRAHVTTLIRRLRRALRPAPSRPRVPAAIVAVRRYVGEHAHRPLRLTDLAAVAGLSVSQLCLLHQRHVGASVMAHLRLTRLQAAARLLRDSALKVRAVADRVGFRDPYHFNKAFRKQFGVPPGAFRARTRG